MAEFGLSKDDKFVNIHGREIPTTTFGPHKEEVCLLSDVKELGFGVYQKSQFAKLSTMNKEFDADFVDHLLEAAKSYMLKYRIKFSHEQIISSIEKCKQQLTTTEDSAAAESKPKTPEFLKNRQVETSFDDDITIKVTQVNSQKSPNPKEKLFVKSTPRRSPLSPLERNDNSSYDDDSTPQQNRNMPKKRVPFKNANNDSFNSGRKSEDKRNDNSFKNVRKSEEKRNSFEPGKPRPPKEKFTYNADNTEINTIVTSIDKPNCIWVRNLDKDGLLEQIHEKVNEEAKYQKVVLRPYHMDTVYMAMDRGSWFRCKIVRYVPLIVFFMDYGNLKEVDEIRQISEELSKIPALAIRITFKETQFKLKLEDEIRIKPFRKNEDGTFFVNILGYAQDSTPVANNFSNKNNTQIVDDGNDDDEWDSEKTTQEKHQIYKNIPEDPVFIGKPPVLCNVEDDQKVVIAHLEDGVFYLKTKQCFEKVAEIENAIKEYSQTAKAVKKVEVDQLVLYENQNDGNFYRAVVLKVKGNTAEIELLDKVEKVSVNFNDLKNINEALSKEPVTFFSGGKLQGFEKQPLSENHEKLINQFIKERKKFIVVLGFDGELDLCAGNQLLSEVLQKMEKKVFLKDMKQFHPEIGVKGYVCGCYKSSTNFALVPSDELTEHIDYVLRSEIEDKEPYTPEASEVCICYYVDNWYRCVVLRCCNNEYEVLLLDFGNIEYIKKEDLRKPDSEVTKLPILALPCSLTNLPEHPNIEDELRKTIMDGEIYKVDVKANSNGKWLVEFPSVYKKIQGL